ncbi:CSC1-like protein 2 [Folsomia candida]|uniref:CSC1-like protein 2 n=1 Tax=Folsomia candida TaxID=158441 RepID=A0A226ETR0_FOLCA|nr:CSC1-like protein 2 [Folsomia candida]
MDAMSDDKSCNIYAKYKNRGRGGFFGTGLNGYEGIPQNLVLNIIGWMIMILLFSFLRKKAWNYGRLALIERTEQFAERVTHMIFGSRAAGQQSTTTTGVPNGNGGGGRGRGDGDNHVIISGEGEEITSTPSGTTATTQLLKPGGVNVNSESPESQSGLGAQQQQSTDHDYSRIVHSDAKVIMDTGYFSWIKIVFSLTDKQYMEKCGFDCVQYLSFQRHLIFLASIVTLTSVVIILPINYQGTPLTDQTAQFNQTTIINLKHNAKLLWVHVILAITFLFLSIAVMRHFSRGNALKFVDCDDPTARRSIMIVGICRKFCMEDKLKMHFEEIYPDVELSEVTFAYDITDLQKVEFSRQTAQLAILYWEDYMAKHGRRPTMTPYYCGAVCWSCSEGCGCDSRDAIEFYSQEEVQFTREVGTERERALTKPLGIAFITFKTVDMAERVVNDYRFVCKVLAQTPQSKFSHKLKSRRWTVNFAPLPEDIYWENLATGLKTWYVKVFVVNIILAIIVAFYTTPVFLLQAIIPLLNINATNATTNDLDDGPQSPTSTLTGLLIDTVPTLLLWIVAGVFIPHFHGNYPSFLGDNEVTFLFILSMTRDVFSNSLTFMRSLTAIITKDFTTTALQWECVFSKDNGALFVNYICTSTFLGTASELMSFVLLVPPQKLVTAIRQSVLWDFQIGSQYAWMMLNFAIFSVFSVIFPIVTPFGLVYLVFKHYVDRYNIYFAYGPTKVEKEVHGTAINFVIVCMFILQINLLAYVTTQGSDTEDLPSKSEAKGLKVFCVVGFCITAALFISQIFFNMCANFSPILYSRMSQEGLNLNPVIRNGDAISNTSNPSREHNSTNVQFAPSVRKNLETPSTNNQSSQARPNITASQNGAPGSHHRRNLSATISEDGNGGRRKYFPKLLQPPKQRHTGMFPSPSPSINSVVSASNNGRNHKNGHGKTVTAVIINEQARSTEERYLLQPKPPCTNSSV